MRLFDSSKKAKKQRCSESAAQPKRPCLPFAPPLLPAPHQASQARPVDGPLSVPSVPAPPAAWTTAFSQPLPSHPPPTYPHQLLPGPPIVVNQHYYIGPPPPPPPPPPQPPHNQEASGKVDLGPVVNLVENLRLGSRVPQVFDDGLPSWHGYGTQLLNQGAAFYDQISSRFDQVVTSIDWDRYAGGGGDPSDPVYAPYAAQAPQPPQPSSRASEPRVTKGDKKNPSRDGVRKGPSADVAAAVLSDNYFSKVDLYENSRLPADLPPLKL
ncbi:hypothetical protein VTK73DRAFT_287 [Phialemonium thermophilum]|uniref:Uncharacterized protein n=1 Tax=Phialemonium thermophilum TaxID=223376 RepID=A0ABR3VVZ4_9PEZI